MWTSQPGRLCYGTAASTPASAPLRAAFRTRRAVLAVALGASVFLELNQLGVGGGQALFFALAPDLAVFYGVAPGLASGQLHPRAVWLYNALHSCSARSRWRRSRRSTCSGWT
jgi:hypothetical protein